jgi:hypothetical protein
MTRSTHPSIARSAGHGYNVPTSRRRQASANAPTMSIRMSDILAIDEHPLAKLTRASGKDPPCCPNRVVMATIKLVRTGESQVVKKTQGSSQEVHFLSSFYGAAYFYTNKSVLRDQGCASSSTLCQNLSELSLNRDSIVLSQRLVGPFGAASSFFLLSFHWVGSDSDED